MAPRALLCTGLIALAAGAVARSAFALHPCEPDQGDVCAQCFCAHEVCPSFCYDGGAGRASGGTGGSGAGGAGGSGGGGMGGSMGASTGGSDAGSAGGAGGSGANGGNAGASGRGGTSTGAGGNGGGDAQVEEDDGCACRLSSGSHSAVGFYLLLGAALYPARRIKRRS